ncbi:hypothetical protein [Bacillus sp. REN3]|uniref:hypothetical protein n=1 Tax=Bacillus sp. REN3 TaxID=2802440 RepID=UPI001AEDEC8F|nr:hypothetical protein [Bacillus sp. REN3]
MICSHRYIKVNRKVMDNTQIFIRQEEQIKLYPDKVITASHHFMIRDILDISFREMSGKSFLYLHTTSGLFSYLTEDHPHLFMKAYRLLKSN